MWNIPERLYLSGGLGTALGCSNVSIKQLFGNLHNIKYVFNYRYAIVKHYSLYNMCIFVHLFKVHGEWSNAILFKNPELINSACKR